ncbi:MAG: hypothetical protein AAGH89_00710 [Verrucomicrobiota bacterium]
MPPHNPNPSLQLALTVILPDGKRATVPDGEFRSLDGKLLFVRRGDRVEIRCPRSKALYGLEWIGEPSAPLSRAEGGSESVQKS